jgi:hypothetical protein
MKLASISRTWKLGIAVALWMIFMCLSALRAAGNNAYDEREEQLALPNHSLNLKCAKPKTPSSPALISGELRRSLLSRALVSPWRAASVKCPLALAIDDRRNGRSSCCFAGFVVPVAFEPVEQSSVAPKR